MTNCRSFAVEPLQVLTKARRASKLAPPLFAMRWPPCPGRCTAILANANAMHALCHSLGSTAADRIINKHASYLSLAVPLPMPGTVLV